MTRLEQTIDSVKIRAQENPKVARLIDIIFLCNQLPLGSVSLSY